MNEQGSRVMNNTLQTINAAATAIASAQNRVPQTSFQKRRWGSGWSIYWCFGAKKQNKRIGHAVFVPETTVNGTDRPVADNSTQPPPIVLPFVAPPSSPASFLQSEPPSATQSPGGTISFSSISKNIYSPGEPNLTFAIGPYAHETQLVSPPAFSTYNTEPSTAPFTPPPESLHLTTPSSPEVPFAKLLDPYHQDVDASHRYPFSQYAFQSYQLQPGSPVSNLISPGSAFSRSGTSSPFLDHEIAIGCPQFLEFNKSVPPKLLSLDKIAPREWGLRQGYGTLTPDAVGPRSHGSCLLGRQNSDIAPLSNSYNGRKNCFAVIDYRVSFEIAAEEVLRCAEKKPTLLSKVGSMSPKDEQYNANGEQNQAESSIGCEPSNEICEACSFNDEGGQWHQKHRPITLGSAKEFNFNNMDGNPENHTIGTDWWTNEKGPGKEGGQCKNWTFFPMMQAGIS